MVPERVDLRRVNVDRLLRALGIQASRYGDKWLARCPSKRHADNKPSWAIRDKPDHPQHALMGCWACSYSGNAITLARDVIGLALWSSAVDWVRENALDTSAPEPTAVRVDVPPLGAKRFSLPLGVELSFPLSTWPAVMRTYVESRGITEEQVERWGIGYALEGRLKYRVVFPIRDSRRRLLSYTSRVALGGTPRYLTPHVSEGAVPSAVFGEQHWGRSGAATTIYLCEGAINALAVERVLPDVNVAAIGGSKLLPGHTLRLSRFRKLVVITDADVAGDEAAEKLLTTFARTAEVVRVRLPVGEDPASLPPDLLREYLRSGAATGAL